MTDAGSGCSRVPVLGSPNQFQYEPQTSQSCLNIFPTDGQGNALLDLLRPGPFDLIDWRSFHATGQLRGSFDGTSDLAVNAFPLQAGWLLQTAGGGFSGPIGPVVVNVFSPDLQSQQVVQGVPPFTSNGAPGGGGVLVSGVYPPPPGSPTCTSGFQPVYVQRFDQQGRSPWAPQSLGCFDESAHLFAAVAPQGNVLVLIVQVPGGPWHTWNIDADGTIHPHTITSPPLRDTSPQALAPLADGHFAVATSAGWEALIERNGTLSSPPCWLASRPGTGPQIVSAGKAYLLFDGSHSCSDLAEYVLDDGTSCGFISVDAGTLSCDSVSVGTDGTLAILNKNTCTIDEWPRAFQ
jgi:hypothetical protein